MPITGLPHKGEPWKCSGLTHQNPLCIWSLQWNQPCSVGQTLLQLFFLPFFVASFPVSFMLLSPFSICSSWMRPIRIEFCAPMQGWVASDCWFWSGNQVDRCPSDVDGEVDQVFFFCAYSCFLLSLHLHIVLVPGTAWDRMETYAE